MEGGREAREGGTCVYMADSLHYAAENNATLQSNYTPENF